MATFLDMTFFGNFSIIFTFLFVYVLIYGIAEMSSPFGKDKKSLNALMALAIAIMLVVSPTMVRLVQFIIPWFFIIALVLFFVLFALRIFSGDKFDFSGAVKDKRVYTWIIVLVVVIMIFGLGSAFGQSSLDKQNGGVVHNDNVNLNNSDYNSNDFIEGTGVGNTEFNGKSVATDNFSTNLTNTIFNPKVLGLMLIMLVAVFAMFFISD